MTFEPKLTLVEDIHDAYKFLQFASAVGRPVLGFDTETKDIDRRIGPIWWQENFVRTVQVGDNEQGFTLPLSWWYKIIKTTLEEYDRPLVAHNFQFDIHSLQNADIFIKEELVHDTMIMSQILDPLRRSHALKPLSDEFVQQGVSIGQGVLKQALRQNGWTFSDVPFEYPGYWAYGALDTCITAELYNKLLPKLSALELTDVYELEMQIAKIFMHAETKGVALDVPYTKALGKQWKEEKEKLLIEIQEYGIQNPLSNAHVEQALRLDGWEPTEFTKTGQASLTNDILEGINLDIVDKIIAYKKYQKWTTTYMDMFLKRIEGNRMHASIKTQEAITGRMSITQPPLQTLPRSQDVRACITVDDGYDLIAIDYSQIEYRLFAHFSQEPAILNKYNQDENADFHGATAIAFFGENYSKAQRSLCKNLNFCILYGGGPAKLAKMSGISVEEATNFINNYKNAFPGVKSFMTEVSRVAMQRKRTEGRAYVRTPLGRKLFAPPGKREGEDERIYALLNSLCQGTAAEFFKQKAISIDNAGLSKYIILPVHDEFLFEIPQEETAQIVPQLVEIMEERTQFSVPLLVEVSGPYKNWGEKYTDQGEK